MAILRVASPINTNTGARLEHAMPFPSIRRIEANSPEIPDIESFLDNEAISGGFSESGTPPAVPVGYDWMWLERCSFGRTVSYAAVLGPNPGSGSQRPDSEIITSLRNGSRSFLNLGQATILEVSLGDYLGDGVRDILLRLSDGAFLLITPSQSAPQAGDPPGATAPPLGAANGAAAAN